MAQGVSLGTGRGPGPHSATHFYSKETAPVSIFRFLLFSASLIKGLTKVSSGERKHSCCPHTPIFRAGDKPSRAPSLTHLNPYTPLSFQHRTAAMETVRRHESALIQQLSRSDNSVKLKQAWDCLPACRWML